ncbi:MAG: gamma-glutamylcyclotransferase family protein [Candidatus Omnitrophota bacterium]
MKPECLSLFVYGSLKDSSVFLNITGMVCPPKREAVLTGYAYIPSRNDYPVIHPDPKGIVAGELIGGLNEDVLRRIDEYEGEGYRRIQVIVECGDERIRAYAYIGANEEPQAGRL